jgi:hypothetical protein
MKQRVLPCSLQNKTEISFDPCATEIAVSQLSLISINHHSVEYPPALLCMTITISLVVVALR